MNPREPAPLVDDTIDLIALVRTLWRYRILIGATTLVAAIAAVALALIAMPTYRAEAVVMPAADAGFGDIAGGLAGRIGGLASLAGIDLTTSGVERQEALAVLGSQQLVEEFVRRNELVDEILAGRDDKATVWFAVRDFRDRVLTIVSDEMDGTTTITVKWKDPATAAAWANGLVALANEIMRTRAIIEANRNIEYLEKQIAGTDVVEMQRVMYELIENETKTLMLANARRDYAFTVVDPAVAPEQRSWPRRKLMVLTGAAIGLLLAILVALGLDTFRRYRAREAAGAGRDA